MKKTKIMIPDEQVREEILKFLYMVRNKARSLSSIATTITEIKKALKPLGITQNQIVKNLDFLVQNGWVIEVIEKRTYISPKGFEFPSEKKLYKLSDAGINYFEGPSKFTTTSRFSGINISNVSGIVILGNNNIVRSEYVDLFKKLDQLENAVKLNTQLTTEEKLSIQADIQVIKDQLIKVTPDKNIIQRAMESISFLGSIPGMTELFKMVSDLISNLFK
jgi:DNA-binding PadR family transcriptional regulator